MTKLIANAAAAGLIAFSVSTEAQVPLFTDFPATFFANIIQSEDFTEENVLLGLQAITAGSGFPAPTPFVSDYAGGPIAAGDYLVIYYDGITVPPNGFGLLSAPGALDIYFFPDAVSDFSFPNVGQGAIGNGPLIWARLYDHVGVEVPDGGSTLALLGLSLTCFAFVRRQN